MSYTFIRSSVSPTNSRVNIRDHLIRDNINSTSSSNPIDRLSSDPRVHESYEAALRGDNRSASTLATNALVESIFGHQPQPRLPFQPQLPRSNPSNPSSAPANGDTTSSTRYSIKRSRDQIQPPLALRSIPYSQSSSSSSSSSSISSSSTTFRYELNPQWSDFEIVKESNRSGSFSTVVKAKRKSDGMNVALKILHWQSNQEQLRRRVLNEVELLKKCKSKYVVGYYGYFQHEFPDVRKWVIVLEWCENTLTDYIKNVSNGLSETRVWNLLLGILAGVYVAHRQHIHHRDLKPDNFLITSDGKVKLSDLGLSKQQASSRTATQSSGPEGTPLFYSPEMLISDYENRYRFGLSSDIWALGCILFMLCSGGKHPFAWSDTPTEQELIKRVRAPESTISYNRLVLSNLRTFIPIIEACLEVQSKDRPSIHDLLLSKKFCGRQRVEAFDATLAADLEDPFFCYREAEQPNNSNNQPKRIRTVVQQPLQSATHASSSLSSSSNLTSSQVATDLL